MSLQFTGTSIWGSIADGITAPTSAAGGISIACWFYAVNFTATHIPFRVTSIQPSTGQARFYFAVNITTGTVLAVAQDDSAISNSATSAAALNLNAWNLLALTCNCALGHLASVQKGYLNGVQFDMGNGDYGGWSQPLHTIVMGGNVSTLPSPPTFGQSECPNGSRLAYPSIWTSVLTQGNITSLYGPTGPGSGALPSAVSPGTLVRCWTPDSPIDSIGGVQTMTNRQGTMGFSGTSPYTGGGGGVANITFTGMGRGMADGLDRGMS